MSVEELTRESSSIETIIEKEQLPGTPYWIVGNKEEGYSLIMGNFRFTEPMPTIEDVKKHLETDKYNIILQTILAVNEKLNQH